jgi:hypothetical protein
MNSKNIFFILLLVSVQAFSQLPENLIWSTNGKAYYALRNNEIVLEEAGQTGALKNVIGSY